MKRSQSPEIISLYQSWNWNAPYDLLVNSVTDTLEYCEFVKSLDVNGIFWCNDTHCFMHSLVHFSNKINLCTLFTSLYLHLWKSMTFHLLLFSTDDPFNEESFYCPSFLSPVKYGCLHQLNLWVLSGEIAFNCTTMWCQFWAQNLHS